MKKQLFYYLIILISLTVFSCHRDDLDRQKATAYLISSDRVVTIDMVANYSAQPNRSSGYFTLKYDSISADCASLAYESGLVKSDLNLSASMYGLASAIMIETNGKIRYIDSLYVNDGVLSLYLLRGDYPWGKILKRQIKAEDYSKLPKKVQEEIKYNSKLIY